MLNLVGQSLGRYHIIEQLGEGGMAIVYKAYDMRMENDVAVKVIRTENLAPSILERALKRFEREAKSLAKLTHANIVKVLDYGEHDGKPYLVMPYLPGGTLKQKLLGKPMEYVEAAQLLKPIAKALAYAHQQGVIHRDIKPANILITQSGDPMLTDFGVAKIIDDEVTMDLTGTSSTVGTPEYMAPEQITSKTVDHRADIYSLGIVFYEMVTGRRPYIADTPLAVLFKHASEPLPRPKQFVPSLPDAVEQMLIKALAKNPQDRYSDAELFVKALDALTVDTSKIHVPKISFTEDVQTTDTLATQHQTGDAFINSTGGNNEPATGPLGYQPSQRNKLGNSFYKWLWGGTVIGVLLAVFFVLNNNSPFSATLAFTSVPTILPNNLQPVPLTGNTSEPTSLPNPAQPGQSTGNLKIVSSLPMTGASLTQTLTIVNAMQLRLEQSNNLACNGRYNVTFEAWDDASAFLGKWDPAVEVANANKAAADPSIVAYLGTFNSGAAKLSIPILNQSGPLVMISPANTYPGLTHSVNGLTESDEPDKYYPTGVRNYVRLSSSDDEQGPAAVNFMVSMGIQTLYIIDDADVYGKGIADTVNIAARNAGITVLAQESYDPFSSSYTVLMQRIAKSNSGNPPDAIFLGTYIDNNAAQVLKDKVEIMGSNDRVRFIGPDGIFTAALIDSAGSDAAEGVFAATPGVVIKDLGDAGRKFYEDYAAKYGASNEPYAVYGYDAMGVALYAIEQVCSNGGDPTDRRAVRDAVFSIKDFNGALGTFSFDENGDITLPYFVIGQVQNGSFVDYGTFTP